MNNCDIGPGPVRRALRRISAACLVLIAATAAFAQECRPLLVDVMQFCPDGTSWQGVPMQAEVKDNVISVTTWYGPEVVLVFSRIPKDAAAGLPRRPKHGDIVGLLNDFSKLGTTYLDYVALERSAPLGEDVPVASMAMHDVKNDWVNLYTYYAEGDARLVVQTGDKGAATLTDRHRELHLEALHALEKLNL